MKIVNIILDSRLGGPQIRIAEVAKDLKKDGIETIVIFPDKESENFEKLLKNYKVLYRKLKLDKLSKNPLKIAKWFFTFIPQVIKLKKVIDEISPDIVHCNASWQWKGVIAGKLSGKKVIWHLNDTKMPFYVKFVFRVLIKQVDGIIVAGSRVRKYYLKSFSINKPVYEIQAPVDTKKFDPTKVKSDENLSKYEGIKILSIGNVNPYKGYEYMIEAANILNKKYEHLWFFVAGSIFQSQKNYFKKLRKMINDYELSNFIFLESVENIPELLKAADIYVCSSVAEASPQSVWEAMAMEKPIVSTDVGSVPDFIKDGENGFIVPVKSPQKLAEKIGVLIEDTKLRKIFGKISREFSFNYLDLSFCTEKHKKLYKKIK